VENRGGTEDVVLRGVDSFISMGWGDYGKEIRGEKLLLREVRLISYTG